MGAYQIAPPIVDHNCATPDAVYGIDGTKGGISIRIKLPVAGMWDRLSEYQQELLRKRMHDALLPSVEAIYAMTWAKCFAGKGDPPYPASHADLYNPRGPIQYEDDPS